MAGTAADAVASMAERMLKEKDARIAELEAALRKWRDDYAQTKRHDDDPWVAVPIHQINALLSERK